MKYTFEKVDLPHLYQAPFDLSESNRLFIFYVEDITIVDIDNKKILKLNMEDEFSVKLTGCITSNNKKSIFWDLWDKLKIYDLETKEIQDYAPKIKDDTIIGVDFRLKIQSINTDKYFVYNYENCIEIIDFENLVCLKRIEDNRTPNTPVFYYDDKSNYLVLSYYFDIYERYPENFGYVNRTHITIINTIDFNIIVEDYFIGEYLSFIYDDSLNKIVALNNLFLDIGKNNIDILNVDIYNKKITLLEKIPINTKNNYRKYLVKNPNTKDILLIYMEEKIELNIFKIDINNYKLEDVLKTKILIENIEKIYLEQVSFSKDGKYLILGFSTGIEIYKVVLS